MRSTVLGGAWAGLVLAVALRHRPRTHRARALVGDARRSGWAAIDLERLGRAVLRDPDAPTLTCRRVGAASASGLVLVGPTLLVPALVPLTIAVTAAGWYLPLLVEQHRAAAVRGHLEAALPEVVDLLTVAVGAGLNVHLAVAAVARRGEGPVAEGLRWAHQATRAGIRLSDALDRLVAGDPGSPIRPLVRALVDAERYGTPLVVGLERLGDEVRRTRQRRAEEAARRVPVKLLFPLVLCVLPAFALLTVAPVLAGSLRALRL